MSLYDAQAGYHSLYAVMRSQLVSMTAEGSSMGAMCSHPTLVACVLATLIDDYLLDCDDDAARSARNVIMPIIQGHPADE